MAETIPIDPMRLILLFALIFAAPLRAEPPRVVATVAPLYGILSDVMRGVGAPELMVKKGIDPHYFSLQPSQISALNDADILFAIGINMEPWLPRILPALRADVYYLADIPGLRDFRLPFRQLEDVGRAETSATPGLPGLVDPHMWLDPRIGSWWIVQTALILADADPENADKYQANAQRAILALDAAVLQLRQVTEAAENLSFVTSHDSLQYLEKHFDLNIVGALSSASGDQAGARSLSRLSRLQGNICLLTDISESAENYADLFSNWPQSGFDPLGYDLAGAPDYLANLYLAIAAALENCLTDP